METNSNSKTNSGRMIFEVWGLIGSGREYQGSWTTLTDAQRIGRIIRDGYRAVEICEVVAV